MCRAKKLIMFLLFNVCAFSFALHSSASYALSLTSEVRLVSVYSTGLTVIGPNISYTNVTSASGGTTGAGVETFRIHFNNASCVPGDIYQVNVNFFNTNQNDSLDAWISSVYGGDNDFSFIETQYQQLDGSTGQVSFTVACTSTFTNANRYLTLTSATGSTLWLYPQEWVSTFYVARYTPINSGTDIHEIAQNAYEINQQLDGIVSTLGTNQDSLDTINDNIDTVNDNISQSNQDANDRYQDEKDTIQDNADNTTDSWEDAQQNLTFEEPTWLLSWFWSLGTTEQCINIPVLASLLHSNETTYCSWWDTTVRSIVSPIVNIFLVCIVSGFIIKWLRSSGI